MRQNVEVERSSVDDTPRSVTLRLTPEEAEFVEHMYMVAYGMVCGFLLEAKGEDDTAERHGVEHGIKAMLANGGTAVRVSALVRAMHTALHHPGQTCEDRIEERRLNIDLDVDDDPEQNWRQN